MAKFTVNGRAVTVENNQKLLRYLRDTLHLTSVKDGCSEGACGTCTVLIDGKPTKACIPQTDKLEGKSIVTVEGLTDFEKQVYTYAFGMAGAVQCGFCIPGMVMSAKGLLDMNPNPTREEAAYAIRNNICRCTGYVKIIDAILLAAELFRKGEVPPAPADWSLGQRVPRVDVEEKVTGTGIYPDDIYLDGMIYGSAVRSQYPRARVLAIHTEEARALPGVVGVFTAEDIPGQNKVGHLVKDWDTMIAVGDITHYLGDAICLVAAETPEILAQAKALVKVDYEELPMVRSPREAMLPDAPLVHRTGNLLTHKHIQRGNPAEAIAKSKHVLTQHFSTPWTEHAFLEPECAVAYPDGDGVMILSTDQGAYDTQHETMGMLGLPAEKVKVRNCLVGGGFGGKEDVTVQHHAALIAYLTKRPVKVKLTRAESILIHPKRHPMEMEFSIGCDENGIIQGVAAEVIADTGAYASLGGPVLERACTHAAGPYNYQNFEIDGWAYYTNNPPAGAFRGFGVTQTCFCIESLLNQMADIVGITPWEIRYRNAIEPGKVLPNGQIADCSTALKETLEAVKDVYEQNMDHAGIACSMKNAGVGVGLPDKGRARLVIEDGVCVIYCAASDIGQGCLTVFCQAVSETTGLPLSKIRNAVANTENAPDSGTTSGSRQTLLSGEAIRGASALLKEAMDEAGGDLSKLEGRDFFYEYFEPTDKLGADVPFPKSHIAYGYATHVVILDNDGKVKEVYAAHDSGKVVNPISIQGQIEGGVLMGMGYALTEDWPLKDCVPQVKYGTLGLLRSTQIPDIHAIYVEKEKLLGVAYGAKGIGEIATIPTAPAIQGAYYALDGKFRTSLPLEDTFYRKKKN